MPSFYNITADSVFITALCDDKTRYGHECSGAVSPVSIEWRTDVTFPSRDIQMTREEEARNRSGGGRKKGMEAPQRGRRGFATWCSSFRPIQAGMIRKQKCWHAF